MTYRHYLITGGTSGLGYEITKILYRKKHQLTLLVRNVNHARQVFPECDYPHIHFLLCDLTDMQQIQTLPLQLSKQSIVFDGIIHCAGIGYFKSLFDHTYEEMIQTYQINATHFAILLNIIQPHLVKDAAIVAISSQAAHATQPYAAHYAASKSALNHILNALRLEVPTYRVLNVNVGPIETSFHSKADPTGHYAEKVKHMMLNPYQLAQCIVKSIGTHRKEINQPKWMHILLKFYQLSPRLYEKIGKPFFMSKNKK
ncbi:SDR family oxidoreductase [Staphylococcus sp. 17KM0847]|uniref:SDR family NAD(P)-dependent oxidoreductase n=1 Tax=Staphylococcus sp. 17KM0847 TaxID=2583989 RepID=UPI0015DD44CF|nr:SDR family NAD(P)-dependent oxidoreductase [Staphylococcus sp. 17KM0847]QLK86113.1 SDR family NAD(P)-dependent oxidoreductase [Staphylococcus sp. 17KM0847]